MVLWPIRARVLFELFYKTEQSAVKASLFVLELRITFNFQNKLYFQREQQSRQHTLYSHKARYNKPIRIPARMVQII